MSNKTEELNRSSYPIILEIATTYSSAKDWVIGPQRNDIIEWICEEYGCQPEELIVKEVPESEWETIYLTDPDIVYDEDLHEDDDNYNVVGNFAQSAKDWTSGIEVLATSEY